jgi:predicted nucleotidyltransferase component of viral defense system
MKTESEGKDPARNIGASVRARLLTIARREGRDYNALLLQFVQERFLYRLSVSPFSKQFILKGALLLRAYPLPVARPTRDIDFLGYGIANNLHVISEAVRSIQKVECNDGVEFHPEKTSIEQITEVSQYTGARVNVKSTIGGARLSLQIDIGFGDIVVPKAEQMEFPVLLDFPRPHLRVYSLESAIAEKFESLVRLNLVTSRMKDIYDIIFIAAHHGFTLHILSNAVTATFSQRETSPEARSTVFDANFAGNRDRMKQWSAFVGLQGEDAELLLPEAIERLRRFILPVFDTGRVQSHWHPESWQWLP